jgi:hypothetical protein
VTGVLVVVVSVGNVMSLLRLQRGVVRMYVMIMRLGAHDGLSPLPLGRMSKAGTLRPHRIAERRSPAKRGSQSCGALIEGTRLGVGKGRHQRLRATIGNTSWDLQAAGKLQLPGASGAVPYGKDR